MAYRTIKCVVYFDIILQLILFTSNFILLIWNTLQDDEQRKYFSDYTDIPLFIGIVAGMVSLALDVMLLQCLAWNHRQALAVWNFVCLAITLSIWISYLVTAIFIQKTSLGVWAFYYLYTKAVLIMTAKADVSRSFEKDSHTGKLSKSKQVSEVDTTSSPINALPKTRTRSEPSLDHKPILPGSRSTYQNNSETISMTKSLDGESLTFCNFLGNRMDQHVDHSMIREPIIKADEDNFVEESTTKL